METDDDVDSDDEDDDDDDDDTGVKEENGVLVLTDSNFDTFMEGKDTVLIEFYAPWYIIIHFSFLNKDSTGRLTLYASYTPVFFLCP